MGTGTLSKYKLRPMNISSFTTIHHLILYVFDSYVSLFMCHTFLACVYCVILS